MDASAKTVLHIIASFVYIPTESFVCFNLVYMYFTCTLLNLLNTVVSFELDYATL